MDNTVIKCLTEEHGRKIIKYFKSLGVDTGKYTGSCNAQDENFIHIYYGLVNGIFSNYAFDTLKANSSISVIKLPEELPKRGDRILVGNEDDFKERIFISFIENTFYPVITVTKNTEEGFLTNGIFDVGRYKSWKFLHEEVVELTLQDISDGKGKGVPTHLIRIKE